MPKLEISSPTIEEDDSDILIAYTDASYHEDLDPLTGAVLKRHRFVSANIWDQGDKRLHTSHTEMPDEYYEHFPMLKSYISRGELAATIGMLYSNPKLFRGRRVVHFVDNAPAMSNLVDDYSGQADVWRD